MSGSYLDWQVGDKVVCVDADFDRPYGEASPREGEIYTIREIAPTRWGIGLRLVEVVNPHFRYVGGTVEALFEVSSFRKVQPRKTSIAILERFLNDANAPIKETV